MTDLGLGVVSGLAAAFFSAVSYLVSRHYGLGQRAMGRKGAALRLLAVSHLLMAAVCIPLTWAAWPASAATRAPRRRPSAWPSTATSRRQATNMAISTCPSSPATSARSR